MMWIFAKGGGADGLQRENRAVLVSTPPAIDSDLIGQHNRIEGVGRRGPHRLSAGALLGGSVKPRQQCKKCPWRRDVDPRTIPGGYSEAMHRALDKTIAEPGDMRSGALQIMACHETPSGAELPCVGWLANQLGPGNNLSLRLAVMLGQIDGNVETVGPQHDRFEDTLPGAIDE